MIREGGIIVKTTKKILAIVVAFVLVISGIYLIPSNVDQVEAIDVPTQESEVDKGMLDVKAQIANTTTDGIVIRFVTSVDSLNYHKVGFEVTPDGGETITHPIKTVFEKIESTTKGVEYNFSPKVVDSSSEYLATAKMRVTDADLNYTVRAFVVLLDGETTVYGAERYISANDGLKSTSINMSFEVDANIATVLQNALDNGTQSAVVSATYGDGTATDGVEIIYVEGTTAHARVDLNGTTTRDDLKSATKFILKLISDGSEIGTAIYRNYYTSYEKGGADTTWLTAYIYGTTSEFVIATDADLYGFAKLCNEDEYTFTDKTVILISDVAIEKNANTANGYPTNVTNTWTPISNNNWFYGTFDGDGNTISGLFRENPADYDGLLFGKIDSTAVIKDFYLTNSYFKNTDGDGNGYRMGLIAGRAYGGPTSRLEDICIKEDVVIETDCPKVGGFIGKVQGADGITIANCWFAGTVIQTAKSGITDGLAGAFVGITKQSLNIINCHSTGSVSSDAKGVGGFIGQIWASKPIQITNCLNQTAVTCNNTDYAAWCGSVIGWMDAGGISLTIDKVYTTCNVIGTTDSASTWTGIGTKSGTVSGSFQSKTDNQLKGTRAFTDTELFKSGDAWIASTNSPILRKFADTPSDWYYGKFEGTTMPEAVTYSIDTAEEFVVFQELVDSGETFAGDTVQLLESIDLNPNWDATSKTAPADGLVWNPIGQANYNHANETYFFDGIFNGKGNTISGVYVSVSGDGVGLFSVVGQQGKVMNLRLANSYIEQTSTGGTGTGSVVGCLRGDLESIYVNSDVAVVGTSSGRCGGIVGETLEGGSNISQCWFAGQVSSTGQATGGIVGRVSTQVSMANCLNTGTVTGGSWASGGLVGEFTPSRELGATLSITKSLVTGTITGTNWVGSFVGGTEEKSEREYKIEIKDSYYSTSPAAVGATRGYCTVNDQAVSVSIEELNGNNALTKTPKLFEEGIWVTGTVPMLKQFADVASN